MCRDYGCNITVVSKFHNRLKSDIITITNQKPESIYETFYSSFVIGKDNHHAQYKEWEDVSHYPELLKNSFASCFKFLVISDSSLTLLSLLLSGFSNCR